MSTYQPVFIGRHEAIDLFYSLRSLREQKNALYIEAEGGLGKTWLLREYVDECRRQRRPWYTGIGAEEDPQNAIIDFYYLENRTVAGLRRSIARRLGKERFPRFWARESERQALEGAGADEPARARLAALEREIEALFFDELRDALRQIRNYTLLLFDTFEVVHNRRVGRWFLETFLPHPATRGYLVVFAGRPRETVRDNLPLNVHFYELQPFSRQEAKEYFKVKYQVEITAAPEEAVIEACEGMPLLMDLAVEYMDFPERRLEDIGALSREALERALVGEFLNPSSDVKQVLHEIAYLKRRYTRSIFEHLREQLEDELDFAEIEPELQAYPFVKYRPEEGIYSLHDEFQRMIAAYAGRDWQVRVSEELYPLVVEGWYTQAIAAAPPGPEKDLLRAEQLAYLLEHDRQAGLARYQAYFGGIQQHAWFDFNDMLWGEVAAYLYEEIEAQEKENGVDPDLLSTAYHLTRQQADWLFKNTQHQAAAFWFQRVLEDRFSGVRRETQGKYASNPYVRLGHCYLRMGRVDDANEVWESALEAAKKEKKVGEQGLFAYNLGHVRVRQGHWDEALQLYNQAVENARKSKNVELMGEVLFVMARQRARQGEIEHAIQDIKRSLALIERSSRRQDLQAQAFIYAGDVYRYGGYMDQAHGYYQAALQLLDQRGGWYDWQVEVMAGLGAVYNQRGIQKREQWEDLKGDVADQGQSFDYFLGSLNISREHRIEAKLMLVLDRLAEVYLELDALEKHAQEHADLNLIPLKTKMNALRLVEEERWLDVVREAGVPFEELDTLGKAQRLFEIAFLHSEAQGEPHLMFDSLVQAASTAQRRDRNADLEYYATLARTLGQQDDPQQERLFFALLTMLQAHLMFKNDPHQAIWQYAAAGKTLVEGGSFGRLLFRRQFPRIREHLLTQPAADAELLCKTLAEAWKDDPQLSGNIREVEDLLLASGNE